MSDALQRAIEEIDERDAFEAWVKTFDDSPDLERDQYPPYVYTTFDVQRAWAAWQAARASAPAAPQVSDTATSSVVDLSSRCTVTGELSDNLTRCVAPSPQPEQTAAQEVKNRLCIDGHLNAALDAVMRSNSPDEMFCIIGDLARAAVDMAFAAAPLSLPAEYAAAALKLKEIGYAWVQTDHGMAWVREELSDARIDEISDHCQAPGRQYEDDPACYWRNFARAVLAAAKGEQS